MVGVVVELPGLDAVPNEDCGGDDEDDDGGCVHGCVPGFGRANVAKVRITRV